MHKFVITPVYPAENHAGPKAKEDINTILLQHDYKVIQIPVTDNKLKKLWIKFTVKQLLNSIQQGDTVVMQVPIKSYYLSHMILDVLQKKQVNTIGIVHDIESLRQQDSERVTKDIAVLNKFNQLIVHSPEMKQWLEEQGCQASMYVLGFFDYLLGENEEKIDYHPNNSLVFAGNLMKSSFIHKIPFDIDLFGPIDNVYFDNKHLSYQGSIQPHLLPSYLADYKFGLVWDGDAVDTISGDTGHYLKYNSPHKASLYIASGLPIIIWKEAALAKIVEKYNLGITINSLLEVEEKIANCDYDKLKENVQKIQQDIITGQCIYKSLEQLEKVS